MTQTPEIQTVATIPPDLINGFEALLTRSFLDGLDVSRVNVDRREINLNTLRLGFFKCVRFRKPFDIRLGMLDFLDTVNLFNFPFIFAVNAQGGEYRVLFGLWDNATHDHSLLHDAFETVFDSIRGFFPGCEIGRIQSSSNNLEDPADLQSNSPDTKEGWWSSLQDLTYRRAITGLPADKLPTEAKNKNESTEFGLEELTDAAPDRFALVVYASPRSQKDRADLIDMITKVHDRFHPLLKVSAQKSETENVGFTANWNESRAEQEGVSSGTSDGKSVNVKPTGIIERTIQNINFVLKGGTAPQIQETSNITEQHSSSLTHNVGTGGAANIGESQSRSMTLERTSKKAAHLEDMLNRLHKRLTAGNGLWRCFTEVYADSDTSADKIAQLMCGMLSGEESRLDPLRYIKLPATVNHLNYKTVLTCPDHPMGPEFSDLSSLLTTTELARITRLPLHEIPGIEVEKLTDYGRNFSGGPPAEKRITLGNLVDRGNETRRQVSITPEQLQRHCFVSGATGSGKSNTMRHMVGSLWRNYEIPFLVIEPVKREYRELQSGLDGQMRVFALGERGSDFSLNPFDFDPAVGLIPHIDLLKAAFNASLGMYSSMPFILEQIIYRAYEKSGWNLETGRNEQLIRKEADMGLYGEDSIRSLFLPVMSDLPPLVDEAIDHFFPKSTEYSGSLTGALKARLGSLTRGAKGALLNRWQSMPFESLLKRPAVLELSPFADNEEKSLVMALILMRLYEYRQGLEKRQGGARDDNPLKHLLVIEEAHRLLAKPAPGGEHSTQSRQKGVEVFADILAEIRSYGQGIVIVDQIPSKLIPDVLRNTDFKIAHRLVDKEDRQVLGATMNLEDDQIKDLARFSPGQAVVYHSGLRRALRVKMVEAALPPMEERRALERTALETAKTSEAPLPEPETCARWAVCMLIYALLASRREFESSLEPALARLPELVGSLEAAEARAEVIRALPLIGDWLEKEKIYTVPRRTARALVHDAALLLKAWFSRTCLDEALSNLRLNNHRLIFQQLAESRRQTDLIDALLVIHFRLPEFRQPELRRKFQTEVRAGLKQPATAGHSKVLTDTLAGYAKGAVLGLPLKPAASRELFCRVSCHFYETKIDT